MAYDFEVDRRFITPSDGGQYVVYTITESDVDTTDEWEIAGFPELATITLLEAEITDAGDEITSIQPELSMEYAFDPDAIGYVMKAESTGASARVASDVRCGPGGILRGRSNVDSAGGGGSVVTTRIVVKLGHF